MESLRKEVRTSGKLPSLSTIRKRLRVSEAVAKRKQFELRVQIGRHVRALSEMAEKEEKTKDIEPAAVPVMASIDEVTQEVPSVHQREAGDKIGISASASSEMGKIEEKSKSIEPVAVQVTAPIAEETREVPPVGDYKSIVLSDEDLKQIKRPYRNAVRVTKIDKITILGKDFKRLEPKAWLNDEIINSYGILIEQRAQVSTNLPKVKVLNTSFIFNLNKRDFPALRRWFKNDPIQDYDFVILPVHKALHWSCGVLDVKNRGILYLDSLHGKNPDFCNNLIDFVHSFENEDGWVVVETEGVPKQNNGFDCGVFLAMFMNLCALGLKPAQFGFDQTHIDGLRQIMKLELLTKRLLVPLKD